MRIYHARALHCKCPGPGEVWCRVSEFTCNKHLGAASELTNRLREWRGGRPLDVSCQPVYMTTLHVINSASTTQTRHAISNVQVSRTFGSCATTPTRKQFPSRNITRSPT
jgi:hypothetical protein